LGDLPLFPELRSLTLMENSITDKEIPHLLKYPRLSKLCLSENNIESLDVFHDFRRMHSLEHLELENNLITYQEDYRRTAFKL
jgi:Leucine-rich repeat (LRR) protein